MSAARVELENTDPRNCQHDNRCGCYLYKQADNKQTSDTIEQAAE